MDVKNPGPGEDGSQLEKEMTLHQCGLVDTCFEEGHYEFGMEMLDRLRQEKYKPSISHVRQLLYIALYPPTPFANDQAREGEQLPAPPTKGSPTKRKLQLPLKTNFAPSPDATKAAQSLLNSLVATNTPESIARALPKFSNTGHIGPLATFSGSIEDSYIARESMCIADSKHSWGMLKAGFIQRTQSSSVSHSSRKRGKSSYDVEEEVFEVDNALAPSSVAENAWPVLDCLIRLFEKDQELTGRSGAPLFSPLLLSQLPPPRSGTGPQWEADAPLDIIFHALKHENKSRVKYGARLMTLLINLSSTVYFDLNMFATSVKSRRFAASPDLLWSLLSNLLPTSSVLNFKVVLCKQILSEASLAAVKPASRPKPQARAAPRARQKQTIEHGDTHAITSATDSSHEGTTIANKMALPTWSEIFQLMNTSNNHIRTKHELLSAFGTLQKTIPTDQRDAEWLRMGSDGSLKQAIETVFDINARETYKHTLHLLL
ncbi:hypothetical protein BJ138DRAFT_276874 [Hygrophoropsis aurantiaca]|uniref:Uncharacterized protein n=1 Tax=Hygrophoropsis aurantiaca TaxID=72124 RepID=A0ACB8A755_9AGAM|nr:hypothetical protein BJ138DRAFT_276874 [Hygrophoropsis aurantiaca]